MISTQSKTIDNAIAASTGADGRWMKPSQRRQPQGDAMRHGERGDRLDQPPTAAHNEQKGQHKREMIDPRQDVLDA